MSLEDKCTQTAPNEQQRHQCDFCEKSYKNKSHLSYHVKTTHYRSSVKKPNYRFFQCRVCHQGRKKNTSSSMSSGQMFFFFVILVFETLSEQLLHEYLCHTLGKVPSTKNARLPFGDHGNPSRGRPERVGGGRQGGEGGGRRQKSLLPLPRPPKKCDVNIQLWLAYL